MMAMDKVRKFILFSLAPGPSVFNPVSAATRLSAPKTPKPLQAAALATWEPQISGSWPVAPGCQDFAVMRGSAAASHDVQPRKRFALAADAAC
ncbi:MAG TPA: hypothetical protein VL974_10585, partial [Magnetospirillum sp.]|nr:hypothetical protein [Magnetospirillum sp.]